MTRARDNQRQRVYDAERDAFGESTCEFDSLADVQAFVDRVTARASVRRRYSVGASVRVKAHDGRGRRRACGSYGRISLPRWSRSRYVVLHEAAHALTWVPGWQHEAWHGWRFCECYLFLVRTFMGREDHDRLRAAFKARRVRYRKPRAAS